MREIKRDGVNIVQCPHCGGWVNKAFLKAHCPICGKKMRNLAFFQEETNTVEIKEQEPDENTNQASMF